MKTNVDKTVLLSQPQFNDIDNLNALSIIAKKPGGSRDGFIGITEAGGLYLVKLNDCSYVNLSMIINPDFISNQFILESFSAQLIRAIWGEEYAADVRLIPIKLPISYQAIKVSRDHQTTLEKYNLFSFDNEEFIISNLHSYPIISPYQGGTKPYDSVLHIDGSFKKIIELKTIGLLIGIADLKAENTIYDSNNLIKLVDCKTGFEHKERSKELLANPPYTEFSHLINTQEGRKIITKFLKFDDSILENLLKQYSFYLSEATINKIRSNFKKLKQLPELQSLSIDDLSSKNAPVVKVVDFKYHENGYYLNLQQQDNCNGLNDSNELDKLKEFFCSKLENFNTDINQTHKIIFKYPERIGLVSKNLSELLGQLYFFNAQKTCSNDDKFIYLLNKIDGYAQSCRDILDAMVKSPMSTIDNWMNKEFHYESINSIKDQLKCFLETQSEIIENNLDNTLKNILTIYHKNTVINLDKLTNKMEETLGKKALNDQFMLQVRTKEVLDNLEPISHEELQLLREPEFLFNKFVLKKPASVLPENIGRIVLYEVSDIKTENKTNIFEITDKNHEKRLFSQIQYIDHLMFFLKNNAIRNQFTGMHVDLIDDMSWSNLSNYDEEIENQYEKIHTAINIELKSLIKDTNQPIEILFLGCGKGDEIDEILSFLKNNKIAYVIYGLDKNAANIKTAIENFKFKSDFVYFLEGDAIDIDKHIETFRRNAGKDRTPGINSITICSGLLAEKIITPQHAFEIFQKTASISNHIITSSKTENLIQRSDAKNCGMRITQKNFLCGSSLTTLERYDFVALDQQVSKLLQKNDSTLNMKGQARAICLIKYIDQNHPEFFKNKVTIQLQEAYIDSDGIEYLKKLLDNKSHLKIQCNGDEEWSKNLPKDRLLFEEKLCSEFSMYQNAFFNVKRRPVFSENFMSRMSIK